MSNSMAYLTEEDARRKAYAMGRLRTAMGRLLDAHSPDEHSVAQRWVNAWGSAIGARRFSPLESEQIAKA
jgi:hypothetical protein